MELRGRIYANGGYSGLDYTIHYFRWFRNNTVYPTAVFSMNEMAINS